MDAAKKDCEKSLIPEIGMNSMRQEAAIDLRIYLCQSTAFLMHQPKQEIVSQKKKRMCRVAHPLPIPWDQSIYSDMASAQRA